MIEKTSWRRVRNATAIAVLGSSVLNGCSSEAKPTPASVYESTYTAKGKCLAGTDYDLKTKGAFTRTLEGFVTPSVSEVVLEVWPADNGQATNEYPLHFDAQTKAEKVTLTPADSGTQTSLNLAGCIS